MKLDKEQFLSASHEEQTALLHEQYQLLLERQQLLDEKQAALFHKQYQFLFERQQLLDEERERLLAFGYDLAKRVQHPFSSQTSTFDAWNS